MRYRFSHTSDDGKTYYWQATRPIPGDSRTEHISCNVAWLWKTAGMEVAR